MPGNSFINFGKAVPVGEGLQKGHEGSKGWIELTDWSWDIEAEHSADKGTGLAVGKASPGNLSISHYFDTSSPTILNRMVAGQHFDLITIDMCKTTGNGAQVYFQVQVSYAYVTKVSIKGSEDGSMTEDVEFAFKEIYLGYKAQKNDGGLEGAVPFEWSVKDQKLALTNSPITTKLK